MIDELARKRAEREGDSRLWSGIDALEDLLERVKRGETKLDQLTVHWFEVKPEGGYRHHYTVAGVTFQQHIALLNVALKRTIEEWLE